MVNNDAGTGEGAWWMVDGDEGGEAKKKRWSCYSSSWLSAGPPSVRTSITLPGEDNVGKSISSGSRGALDSQYCVSKFCVNWVARTGLPGAGGVCTVDSRGL